MVTAKKKKVPWLSSSRNEWHVLQRRCQPASTPIYIPGIMFYSVGTNPGKLLDTWYIHWGGRRKTYRPFGSWIVWRLGEVGRNRRKGVASLGVLFWRRRGRALEHPSPPSFFFLLSAPLSSLPAHPLPISPHPPPPPLPAHASLPSFSALLRMHYECRCMLVFIFRPLPPRMHHEYLLMYVCAGGCLCAGAKVRQRPWSLRRSPPSGGGGSPPTSGNGGGASGSGIEDKRPSVSGAGGGGEDGGGGSPSLGPPGSRGSLRKSLKFLPDLLGGLGQSSRTSRRNIQQTASQVRDGG